jgi:hypothetical protein
LMAYFCSSYCLCQPWQSGKVRATRPRWKCRSTPSRVCSALVLPCREFERPAHVRLK